MASPPEQPIDLGHGPVTLGRHVLFSTLGHGGMSVVYSAYDEALDRKVAIKVLRSGGALRRLRLRREAQALAQLTHPNVVRIYEICAHETLDYIVMELVEGETLRTWARAPARNREEILATYIAAGRGLAAAHRKGIVHRDFKPDNAMVRASDGEVLVMDFGLARDDRTDDAQDPDAEGQGPAEGADEVADADAGVGVGATARPQATPDQTPSDTPQVDAGVELRSPVHLPMSTRRQTRASQALTQVGAVMGTVGYMAPEQVRGRVADARSDQFSYCAAVWEALYRERPFGDTNDLGHYRIGVLAGRIQTPASEDVPSWIRAVLVRGLSVDPIDRWPSMDVLLDALARDPTHGRRRRWGLVAAVTLLGAAVATGWAIRTHEHNRELARCDAEQAAVTQLWNPEVAATLARSFAATDHPVAGTAWVATNSWLDGYADELGQLRRQTCVAERVEHSLDPAAAALASACLGDGQAKLEALIGVLGDVDAGMVQHAAEAASSLPLLSDCMDERRQAGVLRPPPELRDKLLGVQARLYRAEALLQIGERDPAMVETESILADAEALGWDPSIAEALLLDSAIEDLHHRGEQAEALADRAFRKAAIAGDSIGMIEAAVQRTRLAHRGAKLDDAEAWAETAAELISNAGLESSLVAGRFAVVRAEVAVARGNLDDARLAVERGLEILELRLGPSHPALGPGLGVSSAISKLRGEYEDALAVTIRELDIYVTAYGPDSVKLIPVYNHIGGSLHATDEVDRAREYYERGLALVERTLGPNDPEGGAILCNLGLLAYEHGELEPSQRYFERALAVLEPAAPNHVRLIKPLVNLGTIASRLGAHDQAIAYFARADAILTVASDSDADERHVWVQASFADALVRKGDSLAARSKYEASLRAAERTHGLDHAQVIRPIIGLAETEIALGRVAAAEVHIARARRLIDEQAWRLWELEFVEAQLLFVRDPEAGLAAVHSLRATFVAEGAAYSLGEVDVWLAGHDPTFAGPRSG